MFFSSKYVVYTMSNFVKNHFLSSDCLFKQDGSLKASTFVSASFTGNWKINNY